MNKKVICCPIYQTKNGIPFSVRMLKSCDSDIVSQFLGSLSKKTLFNRFNYNPRPSMVLPFFFKKNSHCFAIYIQNGAQEKLVGIAQATFCSGDAAEYAWIIEDAYQNLGIAQQTLSILNNFCISNGISFVGAYPTSSSTGMIHIMEKNGFTGDKNRQFFSRDLETKNTGEQQVTME